MARTASLLCIAVATGLFLTGPSVPGLARGVERKVAIDQVPEVVRKAILAEVGEGRLVDVGEWTDGETRTWEIEMVVDGKEYDVLFDAAGKVLRKTFEGAKPDASPPPAGRARGADAYQDDFDLEHRKFATTGRGRYFVLEPGWRLVLEGREEGRVVRLAITVLRETRTVAGIETRVVEERETVDGELVEVSRNFLARCEATGSVFYFGEEVDEYAGGKVVSHGGAWLHGRDGARAGMLMPGEAVLGARYYQEVAPEVAMDRARVVDVKATIETPAGKFEGCLRCEEENPLDGEREFKVHAPGIGLVRDEDLLLVEHGFVE